MMIAQYTAFYMIFCNFLSRKMHFIALKRPFQKGMYILLQAFSLERTPRQNSETLRENPRETPAMMKWLSNQGLRRQI